MNTMLEDRIGLCSNCNNNNNGNNSKCGYRARRGFDAIYCEMFDICSPQAVGVRRNKRESYHPDAPYSETTAISSLKGLCVNCEHRESCLMPKPESGIWHCEEYE